jgi:hypothetical protein
VLATGATQLRAVFPANEVSGIVVAYMTGIKTALAIPIGATGVALCVSLFSSWKRLHGAAVKDPNGAA